MDLEPIAECVFFLCVLALIILCAGDPDILDGLIKMINK